MSGDGTYGPVSFTPTEVGTYHWVATYTGDSPNTNPRPQHRLHRHRRGRGGPPDGLVDDLGAVVHPERLGNRDCSGGAGTSPAPSASRCTRAATAPVPRSSPRTARSAARRRRRCPRRTRRSRRPPPTCRGSDLRQHQPGSEGHPGNLPGEDRPDHRQRRDGRPARNPASRTPEGGHLWAPATPGPTALASAGSRPARRADLLIGRIMVTLQSSRDGARGPGARRRERARVGSRSHRGPPRAVGNRRRRPGCRTAGLIRSLSAPVWGVTHHSLAARLPGPTTDTVNLLKEVSHGHTRRRRGARYRRRYAPRCACGGGRRGGPGCGRGADDGSGPTRSVTSGCCASCAPMPRAPGVGGGIQRQFRRWPDHLSARAREVGRGGRSPGAAGAPQWRQVRRARRDPRRARGADPRGSCSAALPRRARGGARAVDHPPRRGPRPHQGDQSARRYRLRFLNGCSRAS